MKKRILVAIVAAAMLAAPLPVYASDTEERIAALESEVAELQEIVAELQAAVNGTGDTSPATTDTNAAALEESVLFYSGEYGEIYLTEIASDALVFEFHNTTDQDLSFYDSDITINGDIYDSDDIADAMPEDAPTSGLIVDVPAQDVAKREFYFDDIGNMDISTLSMHFMVCEYPDGRVLDLVKSEELTIGDSIEESEHMITYVKAEYLSVPFNSDTIDCAGVFTGYTNNSGESCMPCDVLEVTAYQNGVEIPIIVFTGETMYDCIQCDTSVEAGTTANVIWLYQLEDSSPVTVEISNGESYTIEIE